MRREADNKIAPDQARDAASRAALRPSLSPVLPPLLHLQQQAGNQAVQSLLCGAGVQAKLAISQPGDPEEREADEVAATIMRSDMRSETVPHSFPVSAPAPSGPAAAIAAASSAQSLPVLGDAFRSPGHALDPATRAFFEPRFNRDLGHVRIHTGPEAADSARALHAYAYTFGSQIAFAPRLYSPHTTAGRTLLAHELTHTLQGSKGGSPGGRIRRQGEPSTNTAAGGEWVTLADRAQAELDKREWHIWYPPTYGDADPKELQAIFQAALDKGLARLWALTLQQRAGPWGNYLNHFYLALHDADKAAGDSFAASVTGMGIAIGPDTGHFQNLDYLDPRVQAPLNPAIANLPFGRSVDNFKSALYDLNYKPSKPGQLSTILRLTYDDGTTIEISLWDISDNKDPSAANAIAQGSLGPGGRVFPSRLDQQTTPRLWAEKRKALAVMQADNEDFFFFVSLGLAGVMSNLPIGPVVGPEPIDVPTVPGGPSRRGTSGGQGQVAEPPVAPRIPGATDAEHAIDQLLVTEGHEVRANPLEGQQGAGRQGDRFVDGVPTEIKSLSGVKNPNADTLSQAISRRVMDGRGQAHNIIVDTREQAGMTREIAERGVRRAYGADNATGAKIQSIRVIGRDFDITVPRTQ
jgi:Domain of unknown function (DUF4157)